MRNVMGILVMLTMGAIISASVWQDARQSCEIATWCQR